MLINPKPIRKDINPTEKYIGVMVAGGKVVDLMMYEYAQECRDNLTDSVSSYVKHDQESEPGADDGLPTLTHAAVYYVIGDTDRDGFNLFETIDL